MAELLWQVADRPVKALMPKFSIVTVSYNAEKTIEDTIHSVQMQEGVEVEHILIDGGSKDGTMAIVDRYQNQFAAIISERDKGIYDAMNKGAALAKGEFIGFLNADDYFASSNSLALLASALEKSDAAWGNVLQVDDEGVPKRLISGEWFKPSRMTLGLMPPHPSFYVRTSRVRAVGGFDHSYKIAGDFDLVRRLFGTSGFTSCYVSELITIMRVGGVSTDGLTATRTSSAEILRSLTTNGEKIKPFGLNFRYLLRVVELIRGRLLSLSGQRFKPNADAE
ncbi:glycosyltransferase [Rhizobium laguerreae]|nr:glycosyltransferase [Rhizobium laguerreae]